MTRMIDSMSRYLGFRHYRYLRLDGSSTFTERRDMVMDWHNRPGILIFLLSTRGGGLGTDLTAADTSSETIVTLFFVDNRATNKPWTVLIAWVKKHQIRTEATDERILKLAQTKKTVEDAVVGSSSGTAEGAILGEAAKPNEVVSLLFDEEELEAGMRAQAAKREALKEKQAQSGPRTQGFL
ncbi:hypothetical protein PSHT_05351 [Puccinia striiformis]|uniref:Chromatin-remodeling ATPase INO80 n=1 Tax=Puccinia striiformis TaxID=27350 RepID=A0A2S4WAU6_9BASI|nr:hypothetical protein PSHT_05351 [Puccinia striiformis]